MDDHLNNACDITIVKRSPELTVDGKCLCENNILQYDDNLDYQ